MPQQPRISVIIATYRPGAGFDRVIASLDAQTLPQDGVRDGRRRRRIAGRHVRAADRGSPRPGPTCGHTDPELRLAEPAAERRRPTLARGEWVLFMDHDDSLYPDALRRLAEYAAETRADLVSPEGVEDVGRLVGDARPGARQRDGREGDGRHRGAAADGAAQALPPGVPAGARHPLPGRPPDALGGHPRERRGVARGGARRRARGHPRLPVALERDEQLEVRTDRGTWSTGTASTICSP